MNELSKFGIAALILVLGFFLGNFLARITKEELKEGKKWFRVLIIVSAIGAIVSLILRKDYILFAFLWIIIVTSRSLKK